MSLGVSRLRGMVLVVAGIKLEVTRALPAPVQCYQKLGAEVLHGTRVLRQVAFQWFCGFAVLCCQARVQC